VSFENFKKWLLIGDQTTLTTARKLLAGSAAGCVGVCLTYPLDLIRTRLSLQIATKHYAGIADAFGKIYRAEGVRGLFKGVGAAFTSVAPFSALNFTCYELLKEYVGPLLPNNIALSAGYGAASGVTAMTILYPLDLLKRQLMVQGHGDAPVRYRNAFHAGVVIFSEQGVKGLYRGLVPSYMKVVPTVSMTWLSYELTKRSLGVSKREGGAGGGGGFG
jgi:solute carrier family 25 (mitochondrial phosphate transporter), member 23/24/25/41